MWRFAASLPTSIRIPSTLAEFRKRHLQALAGSFTEALQLCARAGLVKPGQPSKRPHHRDQGSRRLAGAASDAEEKYRQGGDGAALGHLFDPGNGAVTLQTLLRAANAIGRGLRIELV